MATSDDRDDDGQDWQELVDFLAATAQDVSSDLKLSAADSSLLWQNLVDSVESLKRSLPNSAGGLPPNLIDALFSQPAATNSRWCGVWRSTAVRRALDRSWKAFAFPDLEPPNFPAESKVALTRYLQNQRCARWIVRWERSVGRDVLLFRPESDPHLGFLLDHPRLVAAPNDASTAAPPKTGHVSCSLSHAEAVALFHFQRSPPCNPSNLF